MTIEQLDGNVSLQADNGQRSGNLDSTQPINNYRQVKKMLQMDGLKYLQPHPLSYLGVREGVGLQLLLALRNFMLRN